MHEYIETTSWFRFKFQEHMQLYPAWFMMETKVLPKQNRKEKIPSWNKNK